MYLARSMARADGSLCLGHDYSTRWTCLHRQLVVECVWMGALDGHSDVAEVEPHGMSGFLFPLFKMTKKQVHTCT